MSFTDTQVRQLKSSIRRRHVREREVEGKTLHYLEGWWIVSEANRIFGFDAWERETVSSECVWRSPVGERFGAAYLTRVRITVRAGERTIVREGLGAGEAVAATPGQAHERASKAAETDATKRALSTFGSRFGLSLYGDRMRSAAQAVSEPRSTRAGGDEAGPGERASDAGWRRTRGGHPFMQGPAQANNEPDTRSPDEEDRFERDATGPAALEPMPAADVLNVAAEASSPSEPEIAKEAAREAPGAGEVRDRADDRPIALLPVHLPPMTMPARIDKSVLTLSEPKRRRDRAHLKFVARQACLVCGRTPSQAHHLRIAQPRALGRKVSDEFTVPLCALHHHDLHMKGNEVEWWWGRTIDPLPAAEALWQTSRGGVE